MSFDFTLPVWYCLHMGNRALKRRIVSLRARIAEHEMKIVQEKESLRPDYGLITHWQVEIKEASNNNMNILHLIFRPSLTAA